MESEHAAQVPRMCSHLGKRSSDSGPNKPIHSLASAKLGFLKHRESLAQGQKVQIPMIHPQVPLIVCSLTWPKFSTAGPPQKYSPAYSRPHSSQ